MAFGPWPDKAFVKVFNDDEIIQMGSYTPNVNEQFNNNRKAQLGGFYLYLFKKGVLGGTERIRALVYGNSSYVTPIYTSSWFNLSDISNLDTNWHGWVLTQFVSGHLSKNLTYYVAAEIDNYTRNNTSFFIGMKYDYPNPVYGNASTVFTTQPIAFKPYTYKVRS